MGSNISRLAFFCLPVAVVALSTLRSRVLALAVVPLAIAGGAGTVLDLVNAGHPVSSAGYYDSLIDQLDHTPGLMNCRVEVVDHGAHGGDYALLDHAQLARGWETQENAELNKTLDDKSLDKTTYKIWLDNNAVCYVALPADPVAEQPGVRPRRQGRHRLPDRDLARHALAAVPGADADAHRRRRPRASSPTTRPR